MSSHAYDVCEDWGASPGGFEESVVERNSGLWEEPLGTLMPEPGSVTPRVAGHTLPVESSHILWLCHFPGGWTLGQL